MHFVYRTTNLVNGKFYIGVHTAWSVDDEYLGSGDRLKRAVRKYGRENFQRVVLWVFDTRDEAYLSERDEVAKCLGDPLCMNIHPGGNGGWSEATKKAAWLLANDPEWSAKLQAAKSASMKTRDKLYPSTLSGWKDGKVWVGRSHKEETKRKIGSINTIKQRGPLNSQYGKKLAWIVHPVTRKTRKVDRTEVQLFCEQGWIRGRRMVS